MSACEFCKFYLADNAAKDPAGFCRRYPPTVQQSVSSDCHEHGGDLYSIYSYTTVEYPTVDADDWCGEFQASEPTK